MCGDILEVSQDYEVENYTVNVVGLTLSNTANLMSKFVKYHYPIQEDLYIKLLQFK